MSIEDKTKMINSFYLNHQTVVVVQSASREQLFATPRTAAH